MMEQSIIENTETLECSDRYILPNEWSFIKELLEDNVLLSLFLEIWNTKVRERVEAHELNSYFKCLTF